MASLWSFPRGRAAHEEPGAKVTGVPDAVQMTFGESDHEAPCFSADGRFVYFIAALHDGHDDDLVTSVYRIDESGGEPELIKPHNPKLQTVTAVRASTDGRSLFFTAQDLGDTGRDFVARNSVLYSMPVAGEMPLPSPTSSIWTSQVRWNRADRTASRS